VIPNLFCVKPLLSVSQKFGSADVKQLCSSLGLPQMLKKYQSFVIVGVYCKP
jgi:hypothetical protein